MNVFIWFWFYLFLSANTFVHSLTCY